MKCFEKCVLLYPIHTPHSFAQNEIPKSLTASLVFVKYVAYNIGRCSAKRVRACRVQYQFHVLVKLLRNARSVIQILSQGFKSSCK